MQGDFHCFVYICDIEGIADISNMPYRSRMGKERDDSEGLTERILLPITKSMLEAISDFRFEARFDTRAEAMRHLIQAGLDAERKSKKR
jgi:hypothetical protein